jgi:hypothetical protein
MDREDCEPYPNPYSASPRSLPPERYLFSTSTGFRSSVAVLQRLLQLNRCSNGLLSLDILTTAVSGISRRQTLLPTLLTRTSR